MKIQISMNEDVLKRVDQYADEHYMSRSGVITQACIQILNQDDLMKALRSMTVSMKKIADKGMFSDEVMKDLENWKAILEIYTNNFEMMM